MKIINNINVYEKGEKPVYHKEMPSIPDYMSSQFGWKILELPEGTFWAAMNEMEYRELVGQLLDIEPMDVDLDLISCGAKGDTGCHGDCPRDHYCKSYGTGDTRFCTCGH
ncbi:hypothetical protein CN266_04570 [Bacillus cereus]|uniref:hypothetical protein n=1 Tax=Bacillus cereus TaxID=1396 RepID=UPI000BF4A130|nr:hypothetical protein [Bacillus cereus]PFC67948.1 hypothetical protein CN266_04570 [Bacillus cereus]PFJ19580.1 hypothetical protein COI91_18415 [Bacillus cereus]PGX46192.1 hypothetical protein COE37_23085 [Bacillus cereus]